MMATTSREKFNFPRPHRLPLFPKATARTSRLRGPSKSSRGGGALPSASATRGRPATPPPRRPGPGSPAGSAPGRGLRRPQFGPCFPLLSVLHYQVASAEAAAGAEARDFHRRRRPPAGPNRPEPTF